MGRSIALSLALVCLAGCGRDSGDEADGNETDDGLGFSCPDVAPVPDDACEQANATCTYMSCDDFGVATATCRDDLRWDLDTRACGEVFCHQETCAPGFICVTTTAGFPSGSCVENSCGQGPIGCECPGCGDLPCTANGLTIECNACMSDICP
ncbi:MAG TPA: hypothetical protein VK034_28035 [Enhygromyxa sp.]|nr:hypothetical protein [Enhygromyxa sp.]